MRIDRFLSNLGYGSRSDLKHILKDKRVLVNEQVCVDPRFNIKPGIDKVILDDEEIFYIDNICIALNKPKNYICSNKDELYPSVLNLLPHHLVRLDLKICGRLDYDTEGLVILTSNGHLVHKIIAPSKDLMKKYYVELRDKIKDISKFENGLNILDGKNNLYLTKPAKLEKIEDNKCFVYISEGKFHQVKRMFEAIDNEVVYLRRVSVGKYEMPNDLQVGEYLIIEDTDII